MATADYRRQCRGELTDRLRIEIIGRFSMSFGDKPIVVPSRKARALIGYLVLSSAGEDVRERAAGLLWSGSDPERARGSVRQSLYEIGKALQGAGFTRFKPDQIAAWSDPAMVDVDIIEALGRAGHGEVHPCLVAGNGLAILEDVAGVDPEFSDWLQAREQHYRGRIVAQLERGLNKLASAGALADIEAVARALASVEPVNEEAARALIRCRAAAGDVGTALGIYAQLWRNLEEDYEIRPSQETQQLIARIRMEQPLEEVAPGPLIGFAEDG